MKRASVGLTFSAAVLALVLAPAPALFAQDYVIRMDRPDAVGAKYHISAAGKESDSQFVKQGAQVVKDEKTKFSVEAELVLTVLAVSEKGKNTRVRLDVEKLVRIEGDARTELVPKGSVITASWDGKGQAFEMNGGGLDPDTEESLKLLDLVSDDPNGPSDDDVFGTKERKKVGDRWDANAELLAKDLSHVGAPIAKEDLKSYFTLDKLLPLGKTECMRLSGVAECDKFAPTWLPPALTVEKSALKFNFTETLPIAPALTLPWEETTEMTMAFAAHGKPDPAAEEYVIQMSTEQSIAVRASALNEAPAGAAATPAGTARP